MDPENQSSTPSDDDSDAPVRLDDNGHNHVNGHKHANGHLPAGIVTRVAAAGIDLGVVVALWLAIYGAVAGARLVWSPTTFTWPAPPL